MTTRSEKNEEMVLAHWNYTRQEWKIFVRSTRLKQGRIRYILYRLFGKKDNLIPEITITVQKVLTGKKIETFSDINRSIRRIDIRDSGKMNVLEIIYAILENGTTVSREILVPVPRGKLKKAVQVQEQLMRSLGPV